MKRLQVRNDERGVTLIELVIAITISSVIFTAIAGAFITFLRTDTKTGDRFVLSHDQQLANNFLTQDVQSADYANLFIPGTPNSCYTGADSIVYMQWKAQTMATLQQVVYFYEVVNGVGQLVRQACGPETSSNVAAHSLSATVKPVALSDLATHTLSVTFTDNATPAATFTLSATPRSSLKNPTTTLPGPTTTAPAPTTTTTVAPTTTTIPCTLSGTPTASPTSQKQGNGNKLSQPFVVTIKVTGSCGQLKAEVQTATNSTQSADFSPVGTGTQTASLYGSSWKWDTGPHNVVIKTSGGNVLAPAASNNLVVTVTP